VGCRAVTGREALRGEDERGRVRTTVEEELGEDVEGEESAGREMVIRKTDDDEDDRKKREAEDLERSAPQGIDHSDGGPVPGNGAGTGEDQIPHGGAVVDLIHVVAAREADSGQDDGVVEPEAVVSNVEEKP